MALLKYFKRIDHPNEEIESILLKENGTLSLLMPSLSMVAANSKVMKENGSTGSRGKYQHHTDKEKAEIANKAGVEVWHYYVSPVSPAEPFLDVCRAALKASLLCVVRKTI